MRQTHVITKENLPQPLNVLGETVTVLGAGDLTKPFEVHVQQGVEGGGPPPHTHPWDEAFYILEGEVEITLEDKSTVLSAGSYVHIPAGTIHAYRNLSKTSKLIAVVSDSKGGKMFAEFDAQVHSIPEDLPKLLEVADQFDVVFHLPEMPA